MAFLKMQIIPKQNLMVHFSLRTTFLQLTEACYKRIFSQVIQTNEVSDTTVAIRALVSHVNILGCCRHLQGGSHNPPVTHLLLFSCPLCFLPLFTLFFTPAENEPSPVLEQLSPQTPVCVLSSFAAQPEASRFRKELEYNYIPNK